MAPRGNNSSTLNNEPYPPSYIFKNFMGRKWHGFADVSVNCITLQLNLLLNCEKAKFDFKILKDLSQNSTSLKQVTTFSKYRKSNIFNTEYSFNYDLPFNSVLFEKRSPSVTKIKVG